MTTLALTGYDWLKAFHVLMAVIWVGGAFFIQVLAIRILATKDPLRIAGFAKDVEVVGMRVFLPASIALLGLGFGLVERSDGAWSYGTFFVVWGLAVSIASALVGSLFLGPESGRIGKAVAAGGPESPEAQMRIRRIFLVSRIELALLVLTVFFMAAKPWL